MEPFLDAYAVLGVAPAADQAALKAAHRRLVLAHHPDLRPVAERPAATRSVQEINVAYGLVRDPTRRASYDRLRRIHLARRAAVAPIRRADVGLASADAAAAAQWESTIVSAGRWAGRWWHRNRGRLLVGRLRTRRAAVDFLARVIWLLTTVSGTFVGLTVVSAGQRVAGLQGLLLPLAGALSGLWIASFRGWCRRLRMAGLDDPEAARRGTSARVVAAGLLLAAAAALDARIGWTF